MLRDCHDLLNVVRIVSHQEEQLLAAVVFFAELETMKDLFEHLLLLVVLRFLNLLPLAHDVNDLNYYLSEAGPKMKGCFPAEDIASSVDIEFEGKLYKTMVGYKDYLERTYGDYMTLPPVEQRVTHHFEAYWRD